jgi:hypothetical protein
MTAKGKIGRLPKAIQEQVNRRMESGDMSTQSLTGMVEFAKNLRLCSILYLLGISPAFINYSLEKSLANELVLLKEVEPNNLTTTQPQEL